MSIWGKLVGGVAGFAIGGPIGALIGVASGHAVDKAAETIADPDRPIGAAESSIAFTIGVIALSAKMAKADGQVTRSEVDEFKKIFQVPDGEEKNVGRIFDLARKDVAGYDAYAKQIAGLFRDKPHVLEDLLDGLFRIAMADGIFHPGEDQFLQHVAQLFGFDEHDYARIKASHMGGDRADPYLILGIDNRASDDEVKSAYRTLVRENHPDALIARGVPEEFVEIANDKLAKINDAYDRVAKARGMN